jgi:hypothetical protein
METKMKSIVSYWSTKRLDRNGFEIILPTVDDEQIKRSRHWNDYFIACQKLKIKPNRFEFEKMYNETPKDIA